MSINLNRKGRQNFNISSRILFKFCIVLLYFLPQIHGQLICEHKNIEELIKTSPVILKALGARIFENNNNNDNNYDVNIISKLGQKINLNNKWRIISTPISIRNNDKKIEGSSAELIEQELDSTYMAEALMTLTPETIYKGASLLKVTKMADTMEAGYHYEGQLNATLQPLECFDNIVLDLLPMDIIAFGKVVIDRPDVLKISINGLHRWTPQFENRIWKDLGWDDWSDFTICSVTCGKGVQQRFRRCLLDNPMITANNIPSPSPMVVFHQRPQHQHQHQHKHQHHQPSQHQHQHHHLKPNEPQVKENWRSDRKKKTDDNNNLMRDSKKYFSSSSVLENMKKQRPKKKKSKALSTMSCEGYNIEQRNCNMFECSDDLSDLLKFYKKSTLSIDETFLTTGTSSSSSSGLQSLPTTTTTTSTMSTSLIMNTPITSTTMSAANIGFIQNWRNSRNFTIMMTLRTKNDSSFLLTAQSTIFSLRNATHNLYIDQSLEGLRLYQERDDSTEMLLIKLNLFDNHWHQISISIQNGDFISIYVDCNWINSYIVSKGLFSLPNNADIEIGRGFTGELQQLIVLPGNHERYQCSNVRTSINEVKRYIIDTFIDDYGT